MMNLFIILVLSVLLPSIWCEKSQRFHPRPPIALYKSNSSDDNVVVKKREISNEILYPTEIILKRTASGLNSFISKLRTTFDTSGMYPVVNERQKNEDTDNISGNLVRALSRGSNFDGFPGTLVERRGTAPLSQKDRKIYHRCYFNAVSCFKKKK